MKRHGQLIEKGQLKGTDFVKYENETIAMRTAPGDGTYDQFKAKAVPGSVSK